MHPLVKKFREMIVTIPVLREAAAMLAVIGNLKFQAVSTETGGRTARIYQE
ncbi:hypothetical protein CHS0354_000397 [Potamilus streckersoni]|uniref:Uncharacterized protein n=1 Tax=Potamilus streckersoni TaxID=2493646 RepID=A0AAE0SMW7_9BIVA|nr:hypothetical protein CHS0354_000397 [Potamilus streckersoni]